VHYITIGRPYWYHLPRIILMDEMEAIIPCVLVTL
jgi:hypothetical protein